ncbi:hypothetical protein AGABI2DRAFT_192788 [Agaricus bisporus var. bisporus H97]|uniref:hypothetical protein n=1 Tax=Agaricus bisporus var. bisporus (strain H97 / ATCC MYA-4626 / FGSC 10389) TaxID=936046 RepID=UPI00029F6734|nr:hypothetical protein AGABI2DRAFT_192788 [Agaricus bisporus var. bisporus H97]EKV47610.1 hypothetical protein AGABI2DRAFT_192788 [Agaricus bisporus var. bisporus H97]
MQPTSVDADAKASSKDLTLNSTEEPKGPDRKLERRTILHIDLRILPLLAAIYAAALIDRINLGAADTAGMGEDLQLGINGRFNIVSTLYFVTYIIFQLPGNMFLPVIGIRPWITSCVVAWGAVSFSMGFVKNWQQLTALRLLLGVFEACYFPAMVYLISTWYKRHEVQKRMAAFYLISICISGLSPIFAWALSLLDGKRNIAGWRWIFIVEGAVTIFLGVLCWFGIIDIPHRNKFLSAEQTAFVMKRLDDDRGDAIPDKLTLAKVRKYLSDWKLWAYGVMFLCTTLPAYALAYFITFILRNMGWDSTQALLRSAPPYAPPIITCMLFSWLSDKYKNRSIFLSIQALICLVGLALVAFAKDNGVRYLGTFLINAGNIGTIPGVLAWSSNNVVSHSKRIVQSAITVMFGGVGGILATTTFRAQDAPRYIPGLAVSIGSQVLLMIVATIVVLYNQRMNRLSREGKLSEPLEGQPGFYYTL